MVNAIFISMGREAAAKEKQKRITDMCMAGAAKVKETWESRTVEIDVRSASKREK